MARLIYAALAVVIVSYAAVGCHKNVIVNPKGNQTPSGSQTTISNGPILFNGPFAPPLQTGAVGDFYIDASTGDLYGPKSASGWGLGVVLPGYGAQIQLFSGTVAPSAYTGFPGDYYLDLSNSELFGPKVDYVWGPGVALTAGSPSDTTIKIQ